MGEERNMIRFWWESPKERDHSEERGVDRGWEQSVYWGEWMMVCGVDSVGSG
jgi:hypothetical protein